ncbi:putative P-loop containing nucleoside triphosphate hydrolase [Medicago truncatula]|uniref:Putative P-loop containing nucleoside triphosphate hydrolase n=1 Tax=Medicago truncatula TaxID=3880 RepID=A0A396J898_MEDTR|nr:putative P-loop containing nucleoside triphosphate hydrolase [Medicago truncatula]
MLATLFQSVGPTLISPNKRVSARESTQKRVLLAFLFLYFLLSARSKLKHHTAAVQVPIGLKKDFKGLVDLVQLKAYYFHGLNRFRKEVAVDEVFEEVPADMKALVSEKRRELIETVSKVDEKLAEAFAAISPYQQLILRCVVNNYFYRSFTC